MNYYCQFWQYYLFITLIVIFKWIIAAGNGNNYACAVFLSLFGMDDLSGITDMDMESVIVFQRLYYFSSSNKYFDKYTIRITRPMTVKLWSPFFEKNQPFARISRTNLSENLDYPLIFGRFELAPSIIKRLCTSLHLSD